MRQTASAQDILDMLDRGLRQTAFRHQAERTDFWRYYTHILGWSPPPFLLNTSAGQEFMRSIDNPDVRRLQVLWPPGSGKTTILVAYAAYAIGKNPNVRIGIVTHTLDYSRDLSMQVENILRSRAHQDVFGDVVTQAKKITADEKFFARSDVRLIHPTLLALGVGSSTIGYRLDLILGDDVVTQQNSRSEVERRNIQSYWFGSLMRRLEPRGRVINFGSRWYSSDLYGVLKNKKFKTIEFKILPEGNPPRYRPLWPERFNEQAIAEAYEDDYFTAIAQYGQEPQDLTSSFLSIKFLNYYLAAPEPEEVLGYFMGVDPVNTGLDDNLTIAVIAMSRQGIGFLVDLFQDHVDASSGQDVELVLQYLQKWKPFMTCVEANAAQVHFYRRLEEACRQRGFSFAMMPDENSNNIPKAARLAQTASFFRARRVLVPGEVRSDGSIGPVMWLNPFIQEWTSFPKGRHDDTLDAVDKAVRAAFQVGIEPAAGSSMSLSSQERELLSKQAEAEAPQPPPWGTRRLFAYEPSESLSLFH